MVKAIASSAFSQFTRMLSLIGQGLEQRQWPYIELTGQTQDRQAKCDQFENGKADAFLISLKAGGTGLNLTSADTVIHYDPWWNPAAQAQATDRAYRIGQKRPVFVYNLIIAGSVEEARAAATATQAPFGRHYIGPRWRYPHVVRSRYRRFVPTVGLKESFTVSFTR